MKSSKLFLVLSFVCILTQIKAQYVTIPDNNFVTWLTSHYPSCMNGNQLDTTCTAIVNEVYVNCSYQGIGDLTGIS